MRTRVDRHYCWHFQRASLKSTTATTKLPANSMSRIRIVHFNQYSLSLFATATIAVKGIWHSQGFTPVMLSSGNPSQHRLIHYVCLGSCYFGITCMVRWYLWQGGSNSASREWDAIFVAVRHGSRSKSKRWAGNRPCINYVIQILLWHLSGWMLAFSCAYFLSHVR